jgi:hypothetical protein
VGVAPDADLFHLDQDGQVAAAGPGVQVSTDDRMCRFFRLFDFFDRRSHLQKDPLRRED